MISNIAFNYCNWIAVLIKKKSIMNPIFSSDILISRKYSFHSVILKQIMHCLRKCKWRGCKIIVGAIPSSFFFLSQITIIQSIAKMCAWSCHYIATLLFLLASRKVAEFSISCHLSVDNQIFWNIVMKMRIKWWIQKPIFMAIDDIGDEFLRIVVMLSRYIG